MLGRGGRAEQKWWCRQAYDTRRERVLLSSYEGRRTSQYGSDLIILDKHPEYCDWTLRTAETGDDPSQALVKAKYLAKREARTPEDAPAGQMDEEL